MIVSATSDVSKFLRVKKKKKKNKSMFTHFPELLLLKNINLKFFIKYYLKHFSESKDKTQLPY